ncbi:glycoside hydrolase family 43 protein [Chitinophaga japonensis]|uniref:Beta-xylosidase n=1 Tax=Chitinophaga japonensis TaxID=104662 RepID=A0A562STF3_CHIJA|nr:glycoside hydrolase 43 family protein [Chitinophaga japonensis]TWI84050.1 beta-xylosidase [Chitinophaga japonensis]
MRNNLFVWAYRCVSLYLLAACSSSYAQQHPYPGDPYVSKVWVADQGDGTYKNPILFADYSDPDVVRVGDDFYMTASSFNCTPGLPVLHSKDLVNWTLIGHALPEQVPVSWYNKPQHGNGVWAPAIRYHKGEFYIYYPDPDFGIYVVKAQHAAGPWSEPVLVDSGKGLIDPCPLWDNDGRAYLVHGWAASRAEINSILTVKRLSADGMKVMDAGVHVFDGHGKHPTLEGPKFYKRNGYYYIWAPGGGVTQGWQVVMRSRDIYGPYEDRIVLAQGNTPVNGPHQGAWVTTQAGEDWFIHFQDRGAYGRITHLQPVRWTNDWPVIGTDPDGDGKGAPVLTHKKPDVGKSYPVITPQESDEFNGRQPGLQWQWHANPDIRWSALIPGSGYLRLFAVRRPEGSKNCWDVPNLFLQKFPAPDFMATTVVKLTADIAQKQAGLIVMGGDYAYVALQQEGDTYTLRQVICKGAEKGGEEKEFDKKEMRENQVYLRVQVKGPDAQCTFSYSLDGRRYQPLGSSFQATPDKWIGAKVGIFCNGPHEAKNGGYADFDWFRVTR